MKWKAKSTHNNKKQLHLAIPSIKICHWLSALLLVQFSRPLLPLAEKHANHYCLYSVWFLLWVQPVRVTACVASSWARSLQNEKWKEEDETPVISKTQSPNWTMKLATVAFYGFAVGLLAVGLRELLTGFEENRCSMTYMFEYPEYRVSTNYFTYHLIQYVMHKLASSVALFLV